MNKEGFVEVLKKAGYPAEIENGNVSIILVGGTPEDVKKAFIGVKIIANKVGYKHSFGVKRLEETNGRES